MRHLLSSIAWIFTLVVGCACGGEKTPTPNRDQQRQSTSDAATDYSSLVDRLRASGAGATAAGEVEQPFLSIKGSMVKVYGEDVQIFEYASTAGVDAQAAQISRDGMAVGTRKIFWVGPPHFFKQGKLLVLYVGDNDKVLKVLESVLGRQFAGR